MSKYIVTLTKEERELLSDLSSKGEHTSQKILNALILLGCDAGDFQTNRSTNVEIAKVFFCFAATLAIFISVAALARPHETPWAATSSAIRLAPYVPLDTLCAM